MMRPPKNYMKKLAKMPQEVPPVMLTPTGSPFVYVATTVLKTKKQNTNNDNDVDNTNNNNTVKEEDDEEEDVDPSLLFANHSFQIPSLFHKQEFHFMAPSTLGYDYPSHGKPEVAVLGRSNVGKSSLLNALMRKPNLCRTSKSPGRTQQPYYYGLLPKQQQSSTKNTNTKHTTNNTVTGYLIDLPGYGYGKTASHDMVDQWQEQTQQFLLQRRHVLKRVFVLVDARRNDTSMAELDMAVMNWLEHIAQIPFTIVLTKADCVSVPLIIQQVNSWCLQFASKYHLSLSSSLSSSRDDEDDDDPISCFQSPMVHVTSSQNKWGISELLWSLEAEFLQDDHDDYDNVDDDDYEEQEPISNDNDKDDDHHEAEDVSIPS